MPEDISHKLVIAISSRTLFDLDESNSVFEQEGVAQYAKYQISHEDDILKPGVAFSLAQKLLNINQYGDLVEVILLSRNSADSGLRIFNSIQHHNLNITRAAFTNGNAPYQYIQAFGAHLFLSAHNEDVKTALSAGCAAATIIPSCSHKHSKPSHELRIAFDGDAVIFSDEAERIYQSRGLEAFAEHETKHAAEPLAGGPFKAFLDALHLLQSHFPADQCPIRTALVTARQAPAHKRVIHTLRNWRIRIDEALFLGGLEKANFLNAFGADIFFDDQEKHCESASKLVATGHVPNGIANE
jgi:5'-nucleotidase